MELAAREGVDKFYLSHLVYAGRGNMHRGRRRGDRGDARRLDRLSTPPGTPLENGRAREYVTGNNDADGVTCCSG